MLGGTEGPLCWGGTVEVVLGNKSWGRWMLEEWWRHLGVEGGAVEVSRVERWGRMGAGEGTVMPC